MRPRDRMMALCAPSSESWRHSRRFSYRRLGLLLAPQGIKLNHKKLCRLYREERLW
jgi:putative transposase